MIRLPVLTAFALAATPLAAQTALCAGTGEQGQWIGGSEAGSDISTQQTYAEQMALVLGGNVYAGLFSLTAPTDVRIEAQGRGNGDPILTVYDAAGTEIATDDDSGGNRAARTELELEPGQYCAVVRSFDDSPLTAFVRVARTEAEPLTDGTDAGTGSGPVEDGTCDEAESLGALTGSPLTRQAAPADTPWLAFDLEDSAAFTVTARNEDADPTLRIETADGEVLAENDDYDGLNARTDVASPQAPGRYCIALGALSDTGLPITVEISPYDAAAAVADLYARGEAAPPLDGSYEITDLGGLATRLRMDAPVTDQTSWFSVDAPDGGVLLAEAISIGPNGDPWLVIYDASGRQIALNDDAPSGTDAMILARIGAGTHLIGIKQVAGGTGFVRLLLERFVPAQ